MTFRQVALSAVASIRMGSPAPQGDQYFSDHGKPFVRVQDVGRAGRTLSLTETKDRINDRAVRELRPAFARKGTILFPKSGAAIFTNSRAILGLDAYVVSHLAMVEALPEVIDTEWLYFFLCTVDMGQFSRTAVLPSLRLSELVGLPVPVAALSEQRRIVARIKECMERAEEIEHLSLHARQEAEHLPRAFRFDLWERCQARYGSVDLRSLVALSKNGLYKPREFHGSGSLLLRLFNINGASFDTGRVERVNVTQKEATDYSIVNGDVIISRVNSRELVGKSTVVHGLAEPAVFEAMLIRLRIDPKNAQANFLAWLMNSPQFLHDLRSRAKHAIGQSSINQQDLLSSRLPMPPVAIQEELAASFAGLGELGAVLHSDCGTRSQTARGLRPAILRKAFAGEL